MKTSPSNDAKVWVRYILPAFIQKQLTDVVLIHSATRKEEVAGIRSKFPTKIPVSDIN
jgi:hypothetical protein